MEKNAQQQKDIEAARKPPRPDGVTVDEEGVMLWYGKQCSVIVNGERTWRWFWLKPVYVLKAHGPGFEKHRAVFATFEEADAEARRIARAIAKYMGVPSNF